MHNRTQIVTEINLTIEAISFTFMLIFGNYTCSLSLIFTFFRMLCREVIVLEKNFK